VQAAAAAAAAAPPKPFCGVVDIVPSWAYSTPWQVSVLRAGRELGGRAACVAQLVVVMSAVHVARKGDEPAQARV
jgi:hypothetical protein